MNRFWQGVAAGALLAVAVASYVSTRPAQPVVRLRRSGRRLGQRARRAMLGTASGAGRMLQRTFQR